MNARLLLTTSEAAARLRVTPATLALWIRRGLVPATRTAGGGRYLIAEEDLILARRPARRSGDSGSEA